jgi:hypothetical protein
LHKIAAERLLTLSLEEQENWVQEQSWFKNTDSTEFLESQNVIAMAVDIQDDLDERIENFQDYNNSGFLKFGQVSEKRFAELEEGTKFTKNDIELFSEYLIDEYIGDHNVIEAIWIEIPVFKEKIGAVFYGTSHPIAGADHEFLGIFTTVEEVEKKLSKYGKIIDNFL